MMNRDTVDYIGNPGLQKCGRKFAQRDQKIGARKRFFAFYTLCIWMLYGKANVGVTKNFCALLTFTEIFCIPEVINNAEKWRNTTEVPLFHNRTTSFWSWVNYAWLHLHSSQRRVKRLLWLCGYCVPKTYFS